MTQSCSGLNVTKRLQLRDQMSSCRSNQGGNEGGDWVGFCMIPAAAKAELSLPGK